MISLQGFNAAYFKEISKILADFFLEISLGIYGDSPQMFSKDSSIVFFKQIPDYSTEFFQNLSQRFLSRFFQAFCQGCLPECFHGFHVDCIPEIPNDVPLGSLAGIILGRHSITHQELLQELYQEFSKNLRFIVGIRKFSEDFNRNSPKNAGIFQEFPFRLV